MPSADFTVGVQKAKVQRVGIGFDLSGKCVNQAREPILGVMARRYE
jgi:hypothetical protein